MAGEASWLTAAILVFGGLVIALFGFAAARVDRYVRTKRLAFVCPVRHEEVETSMTQSTVTGMLTGIQRCTAFSDPDRITCQKTCVESINRGSPPIDVRELRATGPRV